MLNNLPVGRDPEERIRTYFVKNGFKQLSWTSQTNLLSKGPWDRNPKAVCSNLGGTAELDK